MAGRDHPVKVPFTVVAQYAAQRTGLGLYDLHGLITCPHLKGGPNFHVHPFCVFNDFKDTCTNGLNPTW